MNDLLSDRQESYSQRMELRPSVEVTSLRSVGDNDPREDLVFEKLGVTCWGRFEHFRNHYSQRWGEHNQGLPLSPRSVEAFLRFVAVMPSPRHGVPSLFLTDSGHLELCWKGGNGDQVQLEFTAQGVEFYIEETDREGSFPYNEISLQASMLPSP